MKQNEQIPNQVIPRGIWLVNTVINSDILIFSNCMAWIRYTSAYTSAYVLFVKTLIRGLLRRYEIFNSLRSRDIIEQIIAWCCHTFIALFFSI